MNTYVRKTICTLLAGTVFAGSAALAKDNIYAYNKFVSTVLGPQTGYCDISLSFKGHEAEYDDVNDYFSGLISAFYDDIDADFDNELVTVDAHGAAVYQAAENGVVFLGSADDELIANFGDSYANAFTVERAGKKFICLETYGKTANAYNMYFYELDAETDELSKILEIRREDNEDGLDESVWSLGKTYYERTKAQGLSTSMNPDGYKDCAAAAFAAIKNLAPDLGVGEDDMRARINGTLGGDDFRFSYAGAALKTYINAKGVRLTDAPVIYFEDKSNLQELRETPDLVTVLLDGEPLQFPTQDPVIIDGRTLVPMRTIFEALGAVVEWKDEAGVQSITAVAPETTINMIINSPAFFVNGESKTLDVPPQLINDKTMVPIRAISESLGCEVGWEQESKTVIITSKTEPARQETAGSGAEQNAAENGTAEDGTAEDSGAADSATADSAAEDSAAEDSAADDTQA